MRPELAGTRPSFKTDRSETKGPRIRYLAQAEGPEGVGHTQKKETTHTPVSAG
jgi:hypothetical protein